MESGIINIQNEATNRRSSGRLQVLLGLRDLFGSVGGGQTVYRKIVEDTPDVDFFYFSTGSQPVDAPANATPILLPPGRIAQPDSSIFPAYRLGNLEMADTLARAVAGRAFDIADFPDFETFGSFLPSAFAKHGVTCKAYVLSLHGNISTSIEHAWGSAGDNALEQRQLEREQFAMADAVYGISPAYIRKWQAQIPREAYLLDPLNFADIGHASQSRLAARPSVYSIGRLERLKGSDILLDVLPWVPNELYRKAIFLGDDVVQSGISGRGQLQAIAKARGVSGRVEFAPAANRGELRRIFASGGVLVIPSRFETLSLIGLEALVRGMPVLVNKNVGLLDYVREYLPDVPIFEFDANDPPAAAAALSHILENHAAIRAQIIAATKGLAVLPRSANLAGFYEEALQRGEARRIEPAIHTYELKFDWRQATRAAARRHVPTPIRLAARNTYLWAHRRRRDLRQLARSLDPRPKPPVLARDYSLNAGALHVNGQMGQMRHAAGMTERNLSAVVDKVRYLHGNLASNLFRETVWEELARLERLRGSAALDAVYGLRLLRSTGPTDPALLDHTLAALQTGGFRLEVEALEAIHRGGPEAVTAFLEARRDALLALRIPTDYAVTRDKRLPGEYRISVICSLYNAAPKLKRFLDSLFQQSAFARGEVEVILVDSGSPTNELEVFEALYGQMDHLLYVRTADRETIQAAWNRGITLSRGKYLSFLVATRRCCRGALDDLADILDKDAGTDWVMADSFIVNLDEQGGYASDGMPYLRTNGTREHAFLDTSYVSWVGGMYRREIHEKHGYYDSAFGAAGDTEFKGRVLQKLGVRYLPKMLGVFINYPEERTTQSPRAEIEDLRAWYIYRTLGGIRYLFNGVEDERAWNLLRACLGYRKSYRSSRSTDFSLRDEPLRLSDRARPSRRRGDRPEGRPAPASGAFVVIERAPKRYQEASAGPSGGGRGGQAVRRHAGQARLLQRGRRGPAIPDAQ
jgi:glycosyltransferase involved in cell wall biosynthesis